MFFSILNIFATHPSQFLQFLLEKKNFFYIFSLWQLIHCDLDIYFSQVSCVNRIIDKSECFTLHDLKRMGVTHTKGTRYEKQQVSGHRSAVMMDIYDLKIPVVKPATE